MHKVVYGIFVGQEDRKRTDAAQLVMEFSDTDLQD